jgi:hypothetical protein
VLDDVGMRGDGGKGTLEIKGQEELKGVDLGGVGKGTSELDRVIGTPGVGKDGPPEMPLPDGNGTDAGSAGVGDGAGTDGWLDLYGKRVYAGAGLHFPSWPAALPAMGRY